MYDDIIIVRVDGPPLPQDYLLDCTTLPSPLYQVHHAEACAATPGVQASRSASKALVDQQLWRMTTAACCDDTIENNAKGGYER